MDTYQTLADPSYGEFKDRGSKFQAYAFPFDDENELAEHLKEIKKLHPKARHHCYAYRIGMDKTVYRANDDGEPSGTAGKPILGQLDSFEVTNTLIIVIRYFGGTLLGASGLINAYRNAAAEALKEADIIEKTIKDIYRLTFDYALMSDVMNSLKKLNFEILKQDFTDIGNIDIAINQSEVTNSLLKLKARIGKLHLEEVEETTRISGLEINYLSTR